MTCGWFATELDACRVSLALALAADAAVNVAPVTGVTTKYNIGTFDRDGRVRQLLTTVGIPQGLGFVDYAERLMHEGLARMATALSAEGAMLSEILALQHSAP